MRAYNILTLTCAMMSGALTMQVATRVPESPVFYPTGMFLAGAVMLAMGFVGVVANIWYPDTGLPPLPVPEPWVEGTDADEVIEVMVCGECGQFITQCKLGCPARWQWQKMTRRDAMRDRR